jgi:hypothetical protein
MCCPVNILPLTHPLQGLGGLTLRTLDCFNLGVNIVQLLLERLELLLYVVPGVILLFLLFDEVCQCFVLAQLLLNNIVVVTIVCMGGDKSKIVMIVLVFYKQLPSEVVSNKISGNLLINSSVNFGNDLDIIQLANITVGNPRSRRIEITLSRHIHDDKPILKN